MPPQESPRQPARTDLKTSCAAHVCPNCGVDHHVTVEHVVRGGTAISRCHCRACGHSWHPVAEPAI